ncbi:MAG: hypothetical protein KIT76_08015 [Pseudolabrys sp.]|nr:hypothetical protein [Pseudolabrys sp.]MCW5696151.1 hypothetical protein [Bauldia sp.]
MSQRSRAPFQPLDKDPLDAGIERLAKEKGVAALVAPQPTVKASPDASGGFPHTRTKPLNMVLPDYLWTELKILAVRQEASVRHVVMDALRQYGLTIRDEDMIEDGRRLRGSRQPES